MTLRAWLLSAAVDDLRFYLGREFTGDSEAGWRLVWTSNTFRAIGGVKRVIDKAEAVEEGRRELARMAIRGEDGWSVVSRKPGRANTRVGKHTPRHHALLSLQRDSFPLVNEHPNPASATEAHNLTTGRPGLARPHTEFFANRC